MGSIREAKPYNLTRQRREALPARSFVAAWSGDTHRLSPASAQEKLRARRPALSFVAESREIQ